jgi:hypothetical protein
MTVNGNWIGVQGAFPINIVVAIVIARWLQR